MAEYSAFKLTNAGLNLRTRCDSLGESLEFTKFELGNGSWVYPESVPAMIALDHPMKVQPVSEVKQLSETEYNVKAYITNADLPSVGFDMTEIGLWAKTTEQDEEILYGVVYAGNAADHLPVKGGSVVFDYLIDIVISTGSADVVVVTVSNAGSVSRSEFTLLENKVLVLQEESGNTSDLVGKEEFETLINRFNSLVAASDSLIGTPIPWLSDSLPGGYALMVGQAFDKTMYSKLAAIYPTGVIPDMRGLALVGKKDVESIAAKLDGEVKEHNHDGSSSSEDLGTKYTNTDSHSHTANLGTGNSGSAPAVEVGTGTYRTPVSCSSDSHNHAVVMGIHGHALVIESTGGAENTIDRRLCNYIVRMA
ncbi:MAG: tail fiber protein [Desulfotalea sp.]